MQDHDNILNDIRILAADDNAINRHFVRGMLDGLVCELVICANGQEAIEHALTSHFDVLLLDLQMPGADGVQVKERVSRFYEQNGLGEIHQQPRYIILTADARKSEQERLIHLGFHGFFSKPISGEHLIEGIKQCIANPGTVIMSHIDSSNRGNIDTNAALRVLNHDPELLTLMRQSSLEELPHFLNQINLDMAAGNWAAAAQQAHKLAGSCAYTGAKRLAEECQFLETELNQVVAGNEGKINSSLDRLIQLRKVAATTAIQFLSGN